MTLKIIAIIAGIYATYCGGVYVMQRQVLFPVSQISRPETRPPIPVPHEVIWLDMPFGRVEAWYLLPPDNDGKTPAPLAILAHGNGDLIDTCLPEAMGFIRLGMGALLVEYPGYGRSEGNPSQETIKQTFVAAYDRIITRPAVDPGRMVFYGRSLGGGAAGQLAEERPSAAMILVSTFTGVKSFAHRFFAPGFLVRDRFDNLSIVKDYREPILIFHGRRDETVPYAHGVKLSEAAPNAQLISYDCGHNDMPPDAEAFWGEIRRFLQQSNIISDANPAALW